MKTTDTETKTAGDLAPSAEIVTSPPIEFPDLEKLRAARAEIQADAQQSPQKYLDAVIVPEGGE